MTATKASGIDWVGEIPSGWDVVPLLAVAHEHDRRNLDGLESNVLSLSYGRIVKRDIESNFGLLPESFATYNCVRPGDVVLRLTDLQNDQRSVRVGLVRDPGIITSAYVTLRAHRRLLPAYFFYLLLSYDVQKVFYGFGGGVRQSMKFDDLRRMPIVVPEEEQQRVIADFLDRRTAAIDALIARKERLVELLQEKRQALITHAVTKGLDPAAPITESGIAPLGCIPVNWKICRLKHAMARIVDCPHETPDVSDDFEYPAVRTADVDRGRLFLDKTQKVSAATYRERTRRHVPHERDILYSREGGRFGHAALVPTETPLCLGQRMMLFQVSSTNDAGYFMWLLNSDYVYRQMLQETLGSAAPRVNIPTISNVWVPKPPRREQQQIAEYVESKLESFDAVEAKVKTGTDRLREYRQALVVAAVTGNLDVTRVEAP